MNAAGPDHHLQDTAEQNLSRAARRASDPATSRPGRRSRRGYAGGVISIAAAAGFAIAILAVMLVVVRPLYTVDRSAIGWVKHTHEVIAAVEGILILADDSETGQRGFLLTLNPTYLEPFNQGHILILRKLSELRSLTADNPLQQSNVQILADLVRDKLFELDKTIALAQAGDKATAMKVVVSGEGKRLMDGIRRTVADMVTQEQALLQQRGNEWQQQQQRLTTVLVGVSILAAVGLLIGVIAGWRLGFVGPANLRRLAAEAAERQRLLDTVNVAAVMMRDLDGTIQFWSDGCERLFGWTAAQAVGCQAQELLLTEWPEPHADIDAALLRKKSWNGELRHRDRNGAEVIVMANKALYERDDRKGQLVVETLTDVTALRHAQWKLQGSEAQFAAFADTAADGFVIASSDGQIQSVNRAILGMLGYDQTDELIGRNIDVLLPAADITRDARRISAQSDGATLVAHDLPDAKLFAVRRDQSSLLIDLSVSTFNIGGARHLSVIIRDATARRQAQTTLRDSEAQLRMFIEAAPAAIAMFDTTMRYLSVSRRFIADYRLAAQTLIGRSYYELFPAIPEAWRAPRMTWS